MNFFGKSSYLFNTIAGFTEEVHMTLKLPNNSLMHAYYEIGTINFDRVDVEGSVIGIVQQISPDFRELSVLRIGPAINQRRYWYLND